MKNLPYIVLFVLALLFHGIAATTYGQPTDTTDSGIDTSEYIPGYPDFNLLIAAENGYNKEVLRLLNAGAEIDSRSVEGVTPLMYAVQNEHLTTCKILLLNGANPNLFPDNGIPPLIAAVKTGNLDVTELLIRNDADVNIQDNEGITPLMYAASFDLPVMSDMLLYYDADIDTTDFEGNTALMVASYYGHQDIVKLLIGHKADLNKQDDIGFTALTSAIQNRNNEVAKMLIDSGAVFTTRNQAGFSPLSIAVLNNNVEMTRYLIDKGANVNEKISFSVLPLNLAKINHNDTLIDLLQNHHAHYNRSPSFAFTAVNFDLVFSARDFMLGGGLGFFDKRYHLFVNAGFMTRVTAKSTLIESTNNLYYQYWERRSFFYLSLTEKLNLINWNYKTSSFGISFGGQVIDSYGRYRGMDKGPGNRLFLSPQLGIFVRQPKIIYSFSYEYINFKVDDLSPNHFDLGVSLLIPNKTSRLSTKKVLWYL